MSVYTGLLYCICIEYKVTTMTLFKTVPCISPFTSTDECHGICLRKLENNVYHFVVKFEDHAL